MTPLPQGTGLPVPTPRFARFQWPDSTPSQRIPELQVAVRVINRANGEGGISPLAVDGEQDVGRFISQYFRAVLPVRPDGHPAGNGFGSPRQVCEGGAEILLTDRRLVAVVIRGNCLVGSVDERNGVVFVIDFPYECIGSVDLEHKKRLFGGVKERHVRIYGAAVPAALEIEPFVQVDEDGRNPVKTSYQVFADALTAAVRRGQPG